jgi:hypothetical protein
MNTNRFKIIAYSALGINIAFMIGYVAFAMSVIGLNRQDIVPWAIGLGFSITTSAVIIIAIKIDKNSMQKISSIFTIIIVALYVIWVVYLFANHGRPLDNLANYGSLLMFIVSMIEIELVEIAIRHYYKGEKVLRYALKNIYLYLLMAVVLIVSIGLNFN